MLTYEEVIEKLKEFPEGIDALSFTKILGEGTFRPSQSVQLHIQRATDKEHIKVGSDWKLYPNTNKEK